MNKSIKNNIIKKLLRLTPVVSTVFFIILFNMHFNPLVSTNIRPSISIICIYFWLVNHENLFGVFSVYAIAIIEEMISSVPLGSNILTILVLYLLTNYIRKLVYQKTFLVFWYGFAFSSFIVLILKWIIISLYYGEALSIFTTLFVFLTTIAFFPIFSVINASIYHNIIRKKWWEK